MQDTRRVGLICNKVRFQRDMCRIGYYNKNMNLEFSACYQALKSRDRRFDGRFFVGVSSTGIYCRPVCPARLPKAENCMFFITAAEAERAGYRPCLRCRPELAPGKAHVDGPDSLLAGACNLIQGGFLETHSILDLSIRLNVTDRHLRRTFRQKLGVTPQQYELSRRLQLARQLIRETALSMTEVALQSGFGSLRAFNAQFQGQYAIRPSDLRKGSGGRNVSASVGVLSQDGAGALELSLGYRPPYDWLRMLGFLSGRIIPGVESVTCGVYRRTVECLSGGAVHRGWLEVIPDERNHRLRMRISRSLGDCVVPVMRRVRALFDLDCDPSQVVAQLGALAEEAPGVRLPGAFDGFEMSVRAILGQQVTVKAAHTLASRVAYRFGAEVETPFAELTRCFPAPSILSGVPPSQLGELGIVRQRCTAILALAHAVVQGDIDLSPMASVEKTLQLLVRLPGIGPWTAQYIAMRALGWPDAFPDNDLGIIKAMGTSDRKEILGRAELWRPWRGYAVMHLWRLYAVQQQQQQLEQQQQ